MKLHELLADYSADSLGLTFLGNIYHEVEDGAAIGPYEVTRYGTIVEGPESVYTLRYAMDLDAFGTSLVSESNYARLTEDFPGVFRDMRWHNGNGLCLLGTDEVPDEVVRALDFLSDCLIYDEWDHSDREVEHFDECWDLYGRRDFARSLESLAGVDEWDEIPGLATDDDLDAAYRSVCEGVQVEYGDEPAFDQEEAARLWLARNN